MYTCKLSDNHWLNLALIRSLQFEEPPLLVMVIWANGDKSFYRSGDALALLLAWDEATEAKGVDKSLVEEPDDIIRIVSDAESGGFRQLP